MLRPDLFQLRNYSRISEYELMDPDAAPNAKPRTSRRALFVGLCLLGTVIAIFVFGKTTNVLDVATLQSTIESLASSPWALPALIVIFCLAAFVGVPQFVLIGFSIAAFGPWIGAIYSWVANLISGTVTFFIGRIAGEQAVRKYAGKRITGLTEFIARNAFLASAIVRNVPTGPFLLVNMVFGATPAKFSHFAAGLAMGAIPKIALVAFAGQSLFAAVKGNPVNAIIAAIATLAIYVGIAAFARRRLSASQKIISPELGSSVDSGDNFSES